MRVHIWFVAAVLAAIAPMPLAMANEPGLSAQEVVRRYSKSVACQIYEGSPSQYVTVQLEPGTDTGFGAVWLVGWTGDLGCMGGNGTQSVQMNLVMQNGFSPRAVSPANSPANKPAPVPLTAGHLLRFRRCVTICVFYSVLVSDCTIGTLRGGALQG